jgi:histidinol-phosphate aminotransferase
VDQVRDGHNVIVFRTSIAAAASSLKDKSCLTDVAARVAQEREKWFPSFREFNLKFTVSSANFVYFQSGVPQAHFAATLLDRGIDIGRGFPPYDRWARISIGLPEENAEARAAVRDMLLQAIT